MTEDVQSSQTPINSVQAKMLRQPVLELILALSVDELQYVLGFKDSASYFIEGLYVLNMFVNDQFEFVWYSVGGCTSSARTRN